MLFNNLPDYEQGLEFCLDRCGLGEDIMAKLRMTLPKEFMDFYYTRPYRWTAQVHTAVAPEGGRRQEKNWLLPVQGT